MAALSPQLATFGSGGAIRVILTSSNVRATLNLVMCLRPRVCVLADYSKLQTRPLVTEGATK
jgi:hypothetical protein